MIYFVKAIDNKINRILFISIFGIFALLFGSLDSGNTNAKSVRLFDYDNLENNEEIIPRLYGVSNKTMLSKGVEFKRYRFKLDDSYIIANVIEADITDPDYKAVIMKAGNNTSEVERLHDMVNEFDSTSNYLMLGAVNGSFWRAYTNSPMGPTIIDGEVVELRNVKNWNSAFFDQNGKLFIDGFETYCEIRNKDSLLYLSYHTNRREDSAGVAIYNSYVGNRIPYVSQWKIERMFREAWRDIKYKDKTEAEFDSVKLKQELIRVKRLSDFDYGFPKISLRYVTKPAMNREFCAVVTSYQKRGSMNVPGDGIVMTFGVGSNRDLIPKIGDTVFLKYSTGEYKDTVFYNGLCGTPRLVREGRIIVDSPRENFRSKRFVKGDLRRTAIGTNKDKTKIYLVTTEGTNERARISGADLKQLAYVMRRIGAYDALNLDGGGSTVMVIDDANVMNRNCPECSRELSVGVGIARRKLSVKSLFDKIK